MPNVKITTITDAEEGEDPIESAREVRVEDQPAWVGHHLEANATITITYLDEGRTVIFERGADW